MIYPTCPECKSENTYHDSIQFVCPDCAYEWTGEETDQDDDVLIVKDSNGNLLSDGDDVLLI
ncbi:TPA: alkylphosphonate utilization protein, partial [Mannheimia haemolytica]|nr:alkylphosphonate utilization protein [Mannheimia haemolytica]